MEIITGFIGGVPAFSNRKDDDFTDRLCYRFSSGILIAFAVIVSSNQFIWGKAIDCWAPAHFTENWEEYINQYCWVKNTYYLPFQDYIPKVHEDDKRHMIPYYQWIPMILAVQALLFYLPCLVWRNLSELSGIDMEDIIEDAEILMLTANSGDREKKLKFMTAQMDRYLSSQQKMKTGCTISLKNCISRVCCMCCGRSYGNYLVVLYIFTKLLYIASAVGQIFVLNVFLGQDFNLYGLEVLTAFTRGEDWTASPRFPRVTMCDLIVRRLGNVQRYTVQCVLPINLFNEKIYLFIWFWMVFVAAMSCYSLILWILRFAIRTDRHRFVKKHLRRMGKLESDSDKKLAVKFVEMYLKQDGCFILRLVDHNTNAITVSEFISSIWDNFRVKPMLHETNQSNNV